MNQFGLKPEAIAQINQIFAEYPEISKAILYGSRAKGNYKNASDIDLQQFPIKRTTVKFLKCLRSKHFKNFTSSGLSAKRCNVD